MLLLRTTVNRAAAAAMPLNVPHSQKSMKTSPAAHCSAISAFGPTELLVADCFLIISAASLTARSTRSEPESVDDYEQIPADGGLSNLPPRGIE